MSTYPVPMFASDFSIDNILSNKGTKRPPDHLLWHCCPLLLHPANDLPSSRHMFGNSGLYTAQGLVPITGTLGYEDFYYGNARSQSYCSDWIHQPSPHCCPGHTGSSISTSQLGFHTLAQVQKRRRRHRTVFTELQLRDLENLFNKTSYPDSNTREKLAQSTHLSQETIKVWFKNRRAKVRKQKPPLLGQLDSSSECKGSETVRCLKQFVSSDSDS